MVDLKGDLDFDPEHKHGTWKYSADIAPIPFQYDIPVLGTKGAVFEIHWRSEVVEYQKTKAM